MSHTHTHPYTQNSRGPFIKVVEGHDPLPESIVVKSVSEFRICIYYIFPTIPSSMVKALHNKIHYISAAKMSNQ